MNATEFKPDTILFWSAVTVNSEGLLEYHVHTSTQNNIIDNNELNYAMDLADLLNFPIISVN